MVVTQNLVVPFPFLLFNPQKRVCIALEGYELILIELLFFDIVEDDDMFVLEVLGDGFIEVRI
jgi:hypothetical protein